MNKRKILPVRKIHLRMALSEDQVRETFDLVRIAHPGPTETVITVTDFAEEKMSQLRARHAQAQDANIIALNLEDIFVELVGPGSTQDKIIQESQS